MCHCPPQAVYVPVPLCAAKYSRQWCDNRPAHSRFLHYAPNWRFRILLPQADQHLSCHCRVAGHQRQNIMRQLDEHSHGQERLNRVPLLLNSSRYIVRTAACPAAGVLAEQRSTHFSNGAYVHLTCVHRPHCGSSNGASAAEKSGALHGQATGHRCSLLEKGAEVICWLLCGLG